MFFIQHIPTSLAQLSHLRYHDISNRYFENFPSVVTRLKAFANVEAFPLQETERIAITYEKIDQPEAS